MAAKFGLVTSYRMQAMVVVGVVGSAVDMVMDVAVDMAWG